MPNTQTKVYRSRPEPTDVDLARRAAPLAIGRGIPSQEELSLCLVDHRVAGDWNFYLGRVSFDFRSVESKDGVYLRGLRLAPSAE